MLLLCLLVALFGSGGSFWDVTDAIQRNIRDHYQWIGHFHTGGNPGRKEIDETQELNYHFIAGAIADLGYQGYISHEYSPTAGHDPIAMLEKAIEICDA